MAFEWDKQLETGIPALDSQHQEIFVSMNAFSEKCINGTSAEEVLKQIEFMECYARKHFSYEETLQQYNQYPGLNAQKEQHKLFLDDVVELKRMLELSGPTKELAIVMKGKLIRWFVQHIKHMDAHFSEFLMKSSPFV